MIEWKYILAEDGKTPLPEPDLEKWARWFEIRANRILRQDCRNGVLISTVFLGIDHGMGLHSSSPVLWETMIFYCTKLEDYQERYTSYEAALAGHERAIKTVEEVNHVPSQ